MPRPEKERIVHTPPLLTEFKPTGIAASMLDPIMLTLDEYEALRLSDQLGYSQEEAAEEMEISRPTFTRLIEKARKKLVDFIVEGKMLVIEGGNIHFRSNLFKCLSCGHLFNTNMNTSIAECPECHSGNLVNLAGGFGHGKCCTNRNRKRGGNYARR